MIRAGACCEGREHRDEETAVPIDAHGEFQCARLGSLECERVYRPAPVRCAAQVVVASERPCSRCHQSMSAFELRDWYATPRYDGKPVENFNTNSFKKAAERAGVRGLRWHDLRHTGAFWAVQNGVTLQELMALCGWKS